MDEVDGESEIRNKFGARNDEEEEDDTISS